MDVTASAGVLRVGLTLQLPRDARSVRFARHLLRAAMVEFEILDEDATAVELALSEACANVVRHAGPGEAYEVRIGVRSDDCEVRVVDFGRGLDYENLTPGMAQLGAEHGRGFALMNALVDAVAFESRPERGTVVHLVKHLHRQDWPRGP